MIFKKILSSITVISMLSTGFLVGCSKEKVRFADPKVVLNSECARSAIAMAIDKQTFVDVILNNGSIPVNYYVPRHLAINKEGIDYRDTVKDMGYVYNLEKAKDLWEQSKDELGFKEVTLEVILSDTEFNRKLGEYLKSQLEQLDGLNIELRQMPAKQRSDCLAKGEYDIAFSGWAPDYPDPLAYLANFLEGQTYAVETHYNSKEYNDLVQEGKKAKDTDNSFEIFAEAENTLLKDVYVIPMYQRASAYLQKDYVKNIIVSTYGTKYHYKWADVDKENKSLRMTSYSDITTLDTCKLVDLLSGDIATHVFEGLTRIGENQEVTPGMAKSWDISEDKLTWTFNLREDATWSNGDNVTAHDFEYAWKKILTPSTAYQNASVFYDIVGAEDFNMGKVKDSDSVGIKAIDAYTFEVKLNRPVPYFDKLVSMQMFSPQNQKFVELKGEEYGYSIENTVFNGPFVLSDWRLSDQYSMSKNPNYWDSNSVNLKEINTKITKDPHTDLNLYETGEIDRVLLSSETVDNYKDSPEFNTSMDAAINFLILNVEPDITE
ncbi:ABC transporter substrate-binding protein [Paraclostridium bifermentans]|uniref:ABC transporter substrate-binding protein n=1 Tax=Paraclostridium bifermentans TaxID=1490 RepID=UPI00359C99DE